MQFWPSFQIEQCTDMSGMRPILGHVNIGKWNGKDVAVACDGFVLAVIPVAMGTDEDGQDADVPGLVHHEIFTLARKYAVKNVSTKMSDIKLTAGTASFSRKKYAASDLSWVVARQDLQGDENRNPKFPDYSSVIEKALKEHAALTVGNHASFNPELLHSLWKALGQPVSMRYSFAGPTSPLVVQSLDWNPLTDRPLDSGHDLTPPFGLIMPMHGSLLSNHVEKHHPAPVPIIGPVVK